MIKAKEYIANPKSRVWIHGLELLRHVLQGDTQQTAYKNEDCDGKHLRRLGDDLAEHAAETNGCSEIFEKTYRERKKTIEEDDFMGDFDIDNYLAGQQKVFRSTRRVKKKKAAITMVMDCGINGGETGGKEMEKRHEKIYRIAAKCARENRPCRVIAAAFIDIPEIKKGHLRLFIIIKNYSDPIYPGIWGAFKTNRSTNTFLNVIMDYFVGTDAWGNGTCVTDDMARDIPDPRQVILVDCERVNCTGAKRVSSSS